MKQLSYIIKLRNSLKEELRHMPLFQNSSAIIVVNEEKQILLEERVDRNMWCLPGGLQELGETFEEVALRELKEETGLVGKGEDLVLIKAVSGKSRKTLIQMETRFIIIQFFMLFQTTRGLLTVIMKRLPILM